MVYDMNNRELVKEALVKAIQDRKNEQELSSGNSLFVDKTFKKSKFSQSIDIDLLGNPGNVIADYNAVLIYRGEGFTHALGLDANDRFTRFVIDADKKDWTNILLKAGMWVNYKEIEDLFDSTYARPNYPERSIFFLESKRERVGTISCVVRNGIPFIENLAVVQSSWGIGWSEIMIKGCLAYCKPQGIPIYARVSTKNYLAIRSLLSCGFEVYYGDDTLKIENLEEYKEELKQFVKVTEKVLSGASTKGRSSIVDQDEVSVRKKLSKKFPELSYTYRYDKESGILKIRFLENKRELAETIKFLYAEYLVEISRKGKNKVVKLTEYNKDNWELLEKGKRYAFNE